MSYLLDTRLLSLFQPSFDAADKINSGVWGECGGGFPWYKSRAMILLHSGFCAFPGTFSRSRYNLGIEILAPRQQMGVFERRNPRPRLTIKDRVFWILLHRIWPPWTHALVIVKPETVASWNRAGFHLSWRFRSWSKDLGRPTINDEIRAVIRQVVEENPTWGASTMHGELLKL